MLLKNARHIPGIRRNFISTRMLDDEGYHNHFGAEKLKLTKSLMGARGKKCSSLYMIDVQSFSEEVNVVKDTSTKL